MSVSFAGPILHISSGTAKIRNARESRLRSYRGGAAAGAIRSAWRSRLRMPRCFHVLNAIAVRRWNTGGKQWNCASRHGFAYYLAMANVLTGWAEAAEGRHAADGLAQLRAGIDEMRRLGAEIRLPYYFALLAETYGRAGQVGEAMASLSTGFAFAGKNGEEWAVPELHRVQGDLLAAQGKPDAACASFRRAYEAARRSGSLALRAKIVDSGRRNGRNSFLRTLLERPAGQTGLVWREGAKMSADDKENTKMSLQEAITEFRGQFRGAVLEPGDAA